MSTTSLTAKYRPQTFADVAGQESVRAILSRAAAEDRVAPAYLFSGTRGVGKTTLARIFAKALNCAQAPTPEPCNQCDSCKQITAGVGVDVVEIDGASNRGIDDARRLREDIGYAPLEGRYKVFIIDEAHMLTKEAFNALLKTLEEPPPRVTFILATTEAHKFPATIISRCQHYGFKTLSQAALTAHLEKIMNQEGVAFEPGALSIIAKRGAGSVRDSMSLLGQALALGEGELKEESVRGFLGLAGQDVFFTLMQGVHERDLAQVGHVLKGILEQGVDLGFFLRELGQCFRNMFLIRQAGDKARGLLELSDEEAAAWAQWASRFEPAFIHACWQMVLEGQRRVMTSPEPALALELLLLNLASLADLLDLEGLAATGRGTAPPSAPSTGNRGGGAPPAGNRGPGGPPPSGPGPGPEPGPGKAQAAPRQAAPQPTPPVPVAPPPPAQEQTSSSVPDGLRTVEGFLAWLEELNGKFSGSAPLLKEIEFQLDGTRLLASCRTRFGYDQLLDSTQRQKVVARIKEYFGSEVDLVVKLNEAPRPKSREELMGELGGHPAVRRVVEAFGARVVDAGQRTNR